MEQILTVWNAMEPRRRAFALAATLGVFLAILGLTRAATQPGMSLLYAGLDPAAAGEVIQVLDQRRIAYEVLGDAIFVVSSLRDETRMTLASQGLPSNSASGYELLDGLTGFGTTAQMFDAAYWRAKEGELARTIMSNPRIRLARVHIAQGSTQVFRRDQRVSASVTITPAGEALSAQHAQALRFLVASAVAGLAPEDVSVIDSSGGMILGDSASVASQASDRADQLRRNVERLLSARVGPGRSVVEVNIDTVTDRETIVERLIDPDSRTTVSQETEERNATASDSRSAGVSVASNLPDGDAAGGDGRSESREVLSRARTDWQVSQTNREIERGPGAIRRLTVAVLVDGVRGVDANGAPEWQPRSEGELADLRELVASAVGYDEARGDVITLRSLAFDVVPSEGFPVGPTNWIAALGLDLMGLIRLAVLALVALFLGLFVLRPLLMPRADPQALDDQPPALIASTASIGPALTGEIDDGARTLSSLAIAEPPLDGVDPVERMRNLIAERQDETLEILRSWMEDTEETR